MTDLDLDALKAAALAAIDKRPPLPRDYNPRADEEHEAARFRLSAIANPAAVLALIERLEEALAWKRANAAQCDTLLRERDAAVSAARNCANAARVAELEQWKESAMRVLGEHHGALQRHGTLGESTADCMDRLARQVAALVAALRHAVQRNHSPSDGCNGCVGIYEALRAAGGQVYTSSVGCIAPHSIVEFYNQAAGRRMIFFWGPDGPYLFDGNQPVYIGQPLKGLLSGTPFASVEPDTITDIRAVDVARVNEIRIWAKDPLTGELSVCFGYDYLTGRWVTHTGMRFTAVGRVDVPRDVSTAGTSDTIRLVTYMAGDARGNVLEIDSGTSDGLPDPTDPTPYDTVAAGSTTTVVNTTNVHPEWVSAARGLNGFVATLIRASGVIETRWILSNTNSTVTVERAFGSAPSQGDVLLVCGIQFHLEFPWDFADAPNDKFFHYLGLWHSGNLYYRFAVDWTALTGTSTLSADPSRRRVRHYINQLSEVLKVELTNYYANQPVTYLARALEIAPIGSNVRAEP